MNYEVDYLLADAGKALHHLGRQLRVRFQELVWIMVDADLELAGLTAPGADQRIITERFSTCFKRDLGGLNLDLLRPSRWIFSPFHRQILLRDLRGLSADTFKTVS